MSTPGGRINSNDPRSRTRGALPATGVAAPREDNYYGGGSYVGSYDPWYGSGYSWYYGYPVYSPYYYGRYSMWYDPYAYGYYPPIYADPYSYGGYGYSSGGGSYSSSSNGPAPHDQATGSVRIRVKPASGKVYLDGTLLGTVDEFDGLTSHLAATVGRHEIEIRADGYQPLKLFVNVEEDTTITARGSMKKK